MLRESEGRARFLRSFPRASLGFVLLVTGACVGATACDSGGTSTEDCQNTRRYYETQVLPFMQTNCGQCHTPDGFAVAQKNARFVLQPGAYPNFIDANLANLREISKTEYEGTSELLLKPIGEMNHGGEVRITKGGSEYRALETLVRLLKEQTDDTSCPVPVAGAIQNVKLLDPVLTLRKAALGLAGRLPTKAETESVESAGTGPKADKALEAALDTFMREEVFFTRVKEIWNDLLLTDKFISYGGGALDFMDTELFPGLLPYDDYDFEPETREKINQAIAQEPLDLITYVIRSDKPFTEILSANYAVVNPFSAIAYGVKNINFKDPNNYNEFHEAQVTVGNGGADAPFYAIPHAGVLSTPAFLNRWTTTETNKSRGRAYRVLKYFLGTDILTIAVRPVDATAVSQQDVPTMNADLCRSCHTLIDPIAGAFRNYDEFNYEWFDPNRTWHNDMFTPGYEGEDMDATYYPRALQYLAAKVADDDRFAFNAVTKMYYGITGKEPLPYPSDSKAPQFRDQLEAWSAQNQFFRDTVAVLAKNNMNLKAAVKEIIKSPYYRGVDARSKSDSQPMLADIGTARMLTPEMLSRKIKAVTGVSWGPSWDYEYDYLQDEYKLIYGGIDSDSVIARLSEPNGVMGAVQQRMASEVACKITAYDFTLPASERRYFPLVDIAEQPESANHPVQGAIANIKANIVFLHEYLLGEKLDPQDPEVERTYQLFLDTWRETSLTGVIGQPWECQGRWNPMTGEELPEEQQQEDPYFTVRAWQAVMTYLLSDYKFLFE
jgi:hypothetical protein